MKSLTEQLWFEVPGRRGFVNITGTVEALVRKSGVQDVYYPNGVHAAYQYDGLMNRLTNLTYMSSASVLLAKYGYASSTNGQWKTATEIQRQVNGTYATNQLGWYYDNLGRLTNEVCSSTLAALNYTNRYVYNLVGNRLWTTNLAGATTTVVACTYNDNDQLLKEVTTGGASGTFTNWYDANGSLTNRSSAMETNSYSYNLQNKLATAIINRTDAGHSLSETINYTYAYNGNRVKAQWVRSVDGGASVNGTNIFLNEASQTLEELPAIGVTPTVSYTLGQHAQSRGGTNLILLSDGHGSTRQLADTNGIITDKYNYDAYGKGLDFTNSTQSPTATEMLYSGEQLDPDLQLYNLQARYYNAANGRFNQIDPFSANQESGENLYAYGADDPVNNSDPNGMYEIDVHQYLTAYLAGKAGFDKFTSDRIGENTQGPDDVVTGGTLDDSRSATHAYKNYALYHFVNRQRLIVMAGHASLGSALDLRYIGEFFHAQEDTFAHSSKIGGRDFHYYGDMYGLEQNGGFYGHLFHGHNPDQTWRDADKALMMARQVFGDLKAVYSEKTQNYPLYKRNPADNDTSPDPDWEAIKGQVQTFIAYPPNLTIQRWKGIFPAQTVTWGGYNTKIQLLDDPKNHYGPINDAYRYGKPPVK